MKRTLILKSFDRKPYSNCSQCPFENKKHILGEGNFGDYIFIGESGGESEDKIGRPFVGVAGKLLTKALDSIGINRYKHWVTNAVIAHPPNNKFNIASTLKARDCCLPGLEKEIEFLYKKGIRILVPLGTNACKSIGMEFDRIGNLVGGVYKDSFFGYNMYIVPNYHPSYIARNGGVKASQWENWIDNFKILFKIKELVENEKIS